MTRRSGVTLVELLITIIIGVIAMLALTAPWVGERSFWGAGRAQTEAQRDAQVVFRAMARVGREAASYAIDADTFGVTFCNDSDPLNCDPVGNPVTCLAHFYMDAGSLNVDDGCAGTPYLLIDGTRSSVSSFTVSATTTNRLRLQIDVVHQGRENELLETELFLRNAS